MAIKNKTIHNPKTKQSIKFLQTSKETGGLLLEMESTYYPHSVEPAAHYHPYQTEDFTVLQGELTVCIDDKILILQQGDTLHIPKNKAHSMWNNTDRKTVVNWKVRPPMNTEYLLETAMGLASDGKTNESGTPDILQSSLMLIRYSDVFRLLNPPYIVQRILFRIIAPFAYLLGYRPAYSRYID